MRVRSIPVAPLALCLVASPALAHIGHGDTSSFATGFFHPLGGIDHVLAMVAVGLYAASLGGAATVLVPAAFVGAMVAGGALGYLGMPFPFVEQAIGISVVVMGLAIALGVRMSAGIAAALVGLFAVFHGHAHGSEGAELASFLPYAAGFVIATTLLHAAGIALGHGLDRFGATLSDVLTRATGTVGALAGVSLMAGWLAV